MAFLGGGEKVAGIGCLLVTILGCTGETKEIVKFKDSRLQQCVEQANTAENGSVEWLVCEGDEGALLDLTGIDQLTQLKFLELSYTDFKTAATGVMPSLVSLKINTGDVSEFTAGYFPSLEYLNLQSVAGELIDLRGAQSLTGLSITGTTLGTSDKPMTLMLDDKPQLRQLSLSHVVMAEIDLSQSSELESLTLKSIYGLNALTPPNSRELQSLYVDSLELPCDVYEFLHIHYSYLVNFHVPSNETMHCGAYARIDNQSLADCVDQTHLALADVKQLDCELSGEITELDVLPQLQSLQLRGNVTSLDLISLPSLQALNIHSPHLMALNLTQNPELASLSLNIAAEAVVQLPSLSALTSLEVSDLWLDVSQFPQLQALTISNKSVESLDLQMLTELQSLTIDYADNLRDLRLAKNSPLKTLVISGTLLTDLDASEQYELETVDVRSTAVQHLSLADTQVLDLSGINIRSLETLDLTHVPANRLELTASGNLSSLTLSGMDELIHFTIGDNLLSEADFSGLTALRFLTIGDSPALTNIQVDGVEKLSRLKLGLTPLPTLDLTGLTRLTELVLGHSGSVANANATQKLALNTLDLSTNRELRTLDVGPSQLTYLDLSVLDLLESLTIDDSQLEAFVLPRTQALQSMALGENHLVNLDLSGATALSFASLNIAQVQQLDLSANNGLTRLSLFAINGDVILPVNSPLKSLSIAQCSAQSSVDSISHAEQLTHLYLDHCASAMLDHPLPSQLRYLEYKNMAVPAAAGVPNDSVALIGLFDVDNTVVDLSDFQGLQLVYVEDDEVSCSNQGSIIYAENVMIDCAQ